MFDSLFGTEGSLIVRVVIALIIVLGLIALAFWLFRRFGVSGVNAGAARGRQPRLAVVDAASVDSRRRLVLVRRDNVEHLIMIGGPTDIVVEQNIVRAVPVTAPREMPVPRTPGAVEAATSRGTVADEGPHMEPPPRTAPEFPRIPRPEPAPRPPRVAESLARLGMPPSATSRPLPEPPPAAPAPEPAAEPPSSSAPADAALASMAQRLEAALRRPPGAPEPAKPAEAALDVPPSDSPATAPQAAPPSKGSSDIDSLQEEMANILGRRLTKE